MAADAPTDACTHCGYIGRPTYVSRVNGLIAVVLLFAAVIPGVLYILYGASRGARSGCPSCGTEGSMVPLTSPQGRALAARTGVAARGPIPAPAAGAPRQERPCPYCAEPILVQARVCKHCGRDVVPLVGA
jgi:hypothetical protein